jgi:ubiquinone/menaquinone biosynthesis C-methylase UbiE
MSFDRVADIYWLLEKPTFGRVLQSAREFGIDKINHPTRALIVGEGDGRFLKQLMRLHPNVQVDCIDASGRMIALAERRLRRRSPDALSRVRFQHADVCGTKLTGEYDLIVTHFVLDCFEGERLRSVVTNIADVALPNCVWLLADFALPDRGWRRLYAKLWLASMYAFFRLTTGIRATTLTDPTRLLGREGFQITHHKRWRAGMVKSQVWSRVGGGKNDCSHKGPASSSGVP